MPAKEILVSVENQVIKLSNLDKLLFANSGIIKAELIEYYQKIAPFILPHIQNRPLTLIRFPDGIDKVKFYSKNKADWTPQWIASTKLPPVIGESPKPENEEIDYVLANNTATLVWLANLAAIELHSMTLRTPNFMPDVFVFDLDPPEGIDFQIIKNVVWDLKTLLENLGYHPFLKTSGSKGLHIYVPIEPIYPTEQVVERAKNIAKDFISTHPNTTLLVSKERRTNKILIDIYRNHRSQTCANAYSVRAKEGAPVSTPIFWDDFENLKSSQQYNIHNVFDYLAKRGDPWAEIYSFKSLLIPNISQNIPFEPKNEPNIILPEIQNLNVYAEKRNFEKTSEPIPQQIVNNSGILQYVIQKHNATNLHYDLRLEHNGVLLS